jgi:hypothetical protein
MAARAVGAAPSSSGGPTHTGAAQPRDTRAEALVDPRVAKHGGTRSDPKSNYDFPGMLDAASWRRTQAHTRWYGCSLCGQKFAGPHAVYTHLAKRHDR